LVFWPCFSVAFVGAMLIAVSQVSDAETRERMGRVPTAKTLLALTGGDSPRGRLSCGLPRRTFSWAASTRWLPRRCLRRRSLSQPSPRSGFPHCLSCVSLKLRCCSRFLF
jgi:hypothetical protein